MIVGCSVGQIFVARNAGNMVDTATIDQHELKAS
jgi:carbonic anhydrase